MALVQNIGRFFCPRSLGNFDVPNFRGSGLIRGAEPDVGFYLAEGTLCEADGYEQGDSDLGSHLNHSRV